jgi:tRNA threonylcarbamoyladenosine biosynthesis protein TsaB
VSAFLLPSDRLAIGIETSTRNGSVAVALGDRVAESALAGERAHASDLLPAVERLRSALGMELGPPAIGAVCVGTGPGSFTGLRVGIATALGLARASGAALAAVPSFAALAWSELDAGEAAAIVLDARAGRWYFARYLREAQALVELVPPVALERHELARRLDPGESVFAEAGFGEGIGVREGAFRRLELRPGARGVLELGLRRLAERGPTPPDALEPLYLARF